MVQEPSYAMRGFDAIDMKLLWFYTSKTFTSFSGRAMRGTVVDEILQVHIVRHAFETPFLMDTVLGLAAMHSIYLNQNDAPGRAVLYRTRALEGYRKAVQEAKPETFPALLANSLLLCALSSDAFRGPDAKPLYILDWITVWRGITLIIKLIKPEVLFRSGMAALFFRPPIDPDESAPHIPNSLLPLVTSITEDDPDYKFTLVYYTSLKCLGALYQELRDGFSSILDLRIITFFTFLPGEFVHLAQQRRHRALVIIAYYLTFVKTLSGVWWIEGISDKEILNIWQVLGDSWKELLELPLAAVGMTDHAEIARLLLNDPSWQPVMADRLMPRSSKTRDPTWLVDTGHTIEYAGLPIFKPVQGPNDC
jgi:hypothetical protein